jgi:hypothetical protein
MENNEFEENITQAFKRINRQQLKAKLEAFSVENEFEEDISNAFIRIERTELKERLKKLAPETEDKKDGTIVRVLNSKSFWKYSLAASVLMFSGFLFYSNYFNKKNDSQLASLKKVEEVIAINPKSDEHKEVLRDEKKTPNATPSNKTTPKLEPQKLRLSLLSNNIGFSGNIEKEIWIYIQPTSDNMVYRFTKEGIIEITSPRKMEVKAILNTADGTFLKIDDLYYKAEESLKKTPLTPLKDVFIIEQLDKIAFNNGL